MPSSSNKQTPDGTTARDDTQGKVANDHNQQGHQAPTALHQSRRTPESRSDRTSHVGSSNQAQSRQGGAGSSRGGAG